MPKVELQGTILNSAFQSRYSVTTTGFEERSRTSFTVRPAEGLLHLKRLVLQQVIIMTVIRRGTLINTIK